MLYSPKLFFGEGYEKINAFPEKIIDQISACLSVGVLVEILNLHTSNAPHLLVDHLSSASAAEKERKTYSRLMGRGEHS